MLLAQNSNPYAQSVSGFATPTDGQEEWGGYGSPVAALPPSAVFPTLPTSAVDIAATSSMSGGGKYELGALASLLLLGRVKKEENEETSPSPPIANTAPTLTLTLTTDTGNSASDGITSNAALTVSGLKSGASVMYVVNGDASTTSYTPPSVDGIYTVTAVATDTAGNTATGAILTFTRDTTTVTPTLTLTTDTGTSDTDRITNNGGISLTGENYASVTYTVNGITSATYSEPSIDGVYTVVAHATDLAGNTAADGTLVFTRDATAPVFSSTSTASVEENIATTTVVYDANATDNGGANDAGITYSLLGTDKDLFSINASTGEVKFNTSPNYENPADSGGNNIYDFTVRATDVSSNHRDQTLALTVTDVAAEPPRGSVIDLGDYGKLIAPVFVDGKWYYVWDMNGDGAHNATQDTSGKYDYDGLVVNPSGSGYQYDYAYHDVLDGIFSQDANGTTGGGGNTDNTYRFATLNGVKLALPTLGDGRTYVGSYDYKAGTAIDNSPAGETNPTYEDLLAVWDGFNGSGVGDTTHENGAPPGWLASAYWSATPSSYGHAPLDIPYGYVGSNGDTSHLYVALQVL